MYSVDFVCGCEEMVRDGVQQYSNKLVGALKNSGISVHYIAFTSSFFKDFFAFLRLLKSNNQVHVQYPVESWGNSFHLSIYVFLIGVLRRKRVLVTLHEFGGMKFLRKLSILPMLLVASDLIFVSDKVRSGFFSSFFQYFCLRLKRDHVTSLFSNIDVGSLDGDVATKSSKDLYKFGFFGFIYESKLPGLMLEFLACLKEKVDAELIVCGDFNLDKPEKRQEFIDKIESLDLADNVKLHGFVEDEKELASILRSVDCNILLFSDGVTARRSSYWYCLDIGRPIITTYPADENEKRALSINELEDGRVLFVEPDISPVSLAGRAIEFLKGPRRSYQEKKSVNVDNAANQHLKIYAEFGVK
jgi:glycosyltransferase involved in cell wall biosynthesis